MPAKSTKGFTKREGPSSPTVAKRDADVPPTPVHPMAKSLAGLLKPMSFRDQRTCFAWCQRILYATGLVLYPVAWYMETFRVFAYGVLLAAGVCCLLFVPNWYQHADPHITYVDCAVTKAYYDGLAEAQKQCAPREQ
jgi:hypothetical protein